MTIRALQMMINLKLDGDTVENKTRIAKVDTTNGKCLQEVLPNNECRHAVLSNLYCSLGQEGKVRTIKLSGTILTNVAYSKALSSRC